MKKIGSVCLIALGLCLLTACAAGTTEPTTGAPAQTTAPETVSQTEQPAETVAETAAETEAVPQTEAETAPTTEAKPAKLDVRLADDLRTLPAYDAVTADAGDPSVHVVFTTDRTVRNVQVLSLMMRDYDENTGKPVFDVDVVETVDALTPARPLVVTTVFYGDLPNNGIAYTDADGTVHRFAVEMSGRDGSLILTAF